MLRQHLQLIKKNEDMRRLSLLTGIPDKRLGEEGLAELVAPNMPPGTCTPLMWVITEAGQRLLTTYQVILK